MFTLHKCLNNFGIESSDHLLTTIFFQYAFSSIAYESLTPNEVQQLSGRHNRHSYLLGRKALKGLCSEMGMSTDTSIYIFPNKFLSLSHTEETAVAAGIKENHVFDGIGIDIEKTNARVTNLTALFLLNDKERGLYYEKLSSSFLTKLWVIKEACFKADGKSQMQDFRSYTVNLMNKKAYCQDRVFYFHVNKCGDFYVAVALKMYQI